MLLASRRARWPQRLALVLLCLLLLPASNAFARRGEAPYSVIGKGSAGAPTLRIAAPDVSLLMEEDVVAKENGQKTFRYAYPSKVSLTPQSDGLWETLGNGTRLWRMEIAAPGATDLNLGFEKFRLPYQGKLWVVSTEADYYEGPYTWEDNEEHGQLWVPVVPGERVILEVQVPAETKFEPELELTHVGYGYRDVFQMNGLPKQGFCNNDVVCPEGDPWRDQIQSVAAYSLGGSIFCTGSMIMDAAGTFKPFFLTAYHCGLNAGNAPSLVVYWNFESPTCGQLSGGSLADNQTGATFRANRQDVDMCLVELDDFPDPTHNVFYAGWDRSGNTPQGSVGIHHPNGDEKAISFNDDPLTTGNSCIGGGGSATHWYVDNWEDGTTEPGSSGSPLFDPDNQLVVGFLSGGLASCTVIDYDCYGKFSVAWDGATATSRLRDWLDPSGTAPNQVQGSFPTGAGTLAFNSASGVDDCNGTGDGVIEPGETVDVSVAVIAYLNDVTGVTGVLSSSTTGVVVTQDTASWPTILQNTTETNIAPFEVALSSGVPCFSTIDFDLLLTDDAGGSFPMSFSLQVGQLQAPSGLPLSIPDGSPAGVTSTFTVAENVVLTDLNVRVAVNHTWVGDLILRLRSPAGTEVTLLDRPGVPASTYGCSNDNFDITFDDSASQALESYCAGTTPWYSGSALPFNALSAFNGESTAGTWTLFVSDNVGADSGSVLAWELIATPGLSPGSCEPCIPAGPDRVLASSRNANPVSVYVTPQGAGNALSTAQEWDGVPGNAPVIVDATIDLQVLDAGGSGYAGFPAADLWVYTSLGGLSYCIDPLTADAATDAAGFTTISGVPFGGGFSDLGSGEVTLVDATGLPVVYAPGSSLSIQFNSADINGDGVIDLVDIGEFSSAVLVSYQYYGDYVWDGVVDLADIGEFAVALNAGACAVPVAKELPLAVEAGSHVGLYFDTAGVQRTATLSPGEDLWAYVVLRGDLAVSGVRAWEGAVRASDNVQLLEWVLPESSLNLRETPQFAVGLGDGSKAKAGDALQLAKVRVRVTDDAPAYLYLDASDQPTRGANGAVVLVGDEPRGLQPQTQPMAAINGEIEDGVPGVKVTEARIFNVPNPFNPATEIRFAVPQAGEVNVRVYDVSGRLVRSFERGALSAGEHAVRWNGRDQNGAEVVSGVYFARLFVDGQPAGSPRKMSLLK